MIHKETFAQPPYQGVPYHVVVQYWDEDGALQAKYFGNYEDAKEFENEIINTHRKEEQNNET